jgi:iron(III) transport system substrate-binding protein
MEELTMNKLIVVLIATMVAAFASSSNAQTPNSQKAWDETLAAAKKEGKVVVTGPPDPQVRRLLPAAFKARYGITLEYLGGRSNEVAAKLRAERGAGVYTVDVMLAGAQTMTNILYAEKMIDPIKPVLMLPEVVDPSKWKSGKPWFMDPEQQYILRLVDSAITLLHLNTRLIKPEELRSSRDLLDPKWKGKIAMMDPTVPGSGISTAAQLYAQGGEDFVKRLYIDQKPMLTRDKRQLTDWLIRGTYPIVFDADDEPLEQLRKDGEPLLSVYNLPDLPPASTSGVGMLAMINKAPHPNAAKVFVNWIASKEGLETYARARALSTTRSDIDEKTFLPPQMIPRPGVKYFDTHGWEFTRTTTEKARLWLKGLLGR